MKKVKTNHPFFTHMVIPDHLDINASDVIITDESDISFNGVHDTYEYMVEDEVNRLSINNQINIKKMKNYTLHYAPLELKGDIKKFKFDTIDELTHKINTFKTPDDIVYLISIDTKMSNEDEFASHIFVSENYIDIRDFIEEFSDELYCNVFCFIMDSYEAAYKMAIEFKEPNKLCYEKDITTKAKKQKLDL